MKFSDIATVSGKGGLFRLLKPSRSGVVLETLDNEKKRFMAGPSQRISVLNEISIFTTDEAGSVPLEDVMKKIHKEFEDDVGLDSNADGDELRSFLRHIIPAYDEDRVYTSDIKKLIKWYELLLKEAPEVLKEAPEADSKGKEKVTRKSNKEEGEK
jgi:hypothetical protein